MRHFRDRAAAAATWGVLVLAFLPVHADPAAPTAVDTAADPAAEARAFAAIRAAGRLEAEPGAPHPLPLASSWQNAGGPLSFDPNYVIRRIRAGGYLLPWFVLPGPGSEADQYEHGAQRLYYEPAIQTLAHEGVPLSFVSPQWELLLPAISAAYPTAADGGTLPLSPYGPVEPWAEVGRAWARGATLRHLEALYPDPPLVLFLSDNEQSKLSAADLGIRTDTAPEDIRRRREIGDRWIERYRAMVRGFREGLEAPGWRAHAVFVGYDAIAGAATGRWGGWRGYSLQVPGRLEPWPYAWDGASVSYYLHDWAPDADDIVWSPEIEAMNFLPQLAEIRRAKPAFWFEISTWDGQEPGQPTDKWWFFQKRGEEWTAERYGGMVQFGMWLMRPRVVREFRNPEHDRIRFGPYFEAVIAAVGRVHDEPLLRDFWEHGVLVPNPSAGHPYEVALTADVAAASRWFLLDSADNPPRPWKLDTQLAVYALALARGDLPHREWLVYTFSPLSARRQVSVTIPDGPTVLLPSGRAGCFTRVNAAGAALQTVGC